MCTLSVISNEADFALFKHFGFRSARDVDKFADYPAEFYAIAENKIPYITAGTNAYYQNDINPSRRRLARRRKGETIWRYLVCGYEWVGEELPDVFICPICKHPKVDFEKIGR